MNAFYKALIGTVLVAAIAVLGIYSQRFAVAAEPLSLEKSEIELLVSKNVGARERQEMAANPEARKQFLDRIRTQLALAAEAQRLGLGADEQTKTMQELTEAQVLANAYAEKNPDEVRGPRGQLEVPAEQLDPWIQQNEARLTAYEGMLKERAHGMPAPERKDIATLLYLSEKARETRLQTDPEVALQLKLQRIGLLINSMNEKLEEQAELSDEEVKAYYEEQKAQGQLDEVHAQHILFATVPTGMGPAGAEAPDPEAKRQQAEQVLERIRQGEDFGELAKQFSDDPGSKEQGGDLGFSQRFKFVPEFEEAAWKLQPGEVSGLVKTDYGYHIIKVLERRPAPELTAQFSSQLKESLTQERYEKLVEEITGRNSVSLPADFEVEAPPAGPPPSFGMPPGMPEGDPHGHP